MHQWMKTKGQEIFQVVHEKKFQQNRKADASEGLQAALKHLQNGFFLTIYSKSYSPKLYTTNEEKEERRGGEFTSRQRRWS